MPTVREVISKEQFMEASRLPVMMGRGEPFAMVVGVNKEVLGQEADVSTIRKHNFRHPERCMDLVVIRTVVQPNALYAVTKEEFPTTMRALNMPEVDIQKILDPDEGRTKEEDIAALTSEVSVQAEIEWYTDDCCICGKDPEVVGCEDEDEVFQDLYQQGWRIRESELHALRGLMCPACIIIREEDR